MRIDISKKDKAAVLKALYDYAKPRGWRRLFNRPINITIEQARELIDITMNFDYVGGRVIKVDISGDSFNPWAYDRNNGEGRAQEAIATVPDTI